MEMATRQISSNILTIVKETVYPPWNAIVCYSALSLNLVKRVGQTNYFGVVIKLATACVDADRQQKGRRKEFHFVRKKPGL